MKTVKAIEWMSISFILAIMVCLISYFNYLTILSGINQSELDLNDGHIIYSIQHEANPLDQNIEHFKQLYELLTHNKEYEYYEVYKQYLEMPDQKGLFYEEGTNELSQKCAGITCVQIDKKGMDHYPIRILTGRSFQEEDFIHKKEKAIPILMGYDYSSLYDRGDTFEAEYLFDQYRFQVIGFLSAGSRITNATHNLELDQSILMPSFTIDNSVPITNGLKIHYANKTSGFVPLKETNHHIFHEIIAPLLENAKTGKYSWTVTPLEFQYQEVFHIGIDQSKFFLLFFMIPILLVEIYLIYIFSDCNRKSSHLFTGQNAFYTLSLFVFTSIAYVSICFLS